MSAVLTCFNWLWSSFCWPTTGIWTYFSSSHEHGLHSRSSRPPGASSRSSQPIVCQCGCQEVWHGALLPSCLGLDRRHHVGVIDTQLSEPRLAPAAGCLQDQSWADCWLLGHYVKQNQRMVYFLHDLGWHRSYVLVGLTVNTLFYWQNKGKFPPCAISRGIFCWVMIHLPRIQREELCLGCLPQISSKSLTCLPAELSLQCVTPVVPLLPTRYSAMKSADMQMFWTQSEAVVSQAFYQVHMITARRSA